MQAAILALPRVESRVLAILWHLADVFGSVNADGVLVPLKLTHERLGRLVGAQRPTVTLDVFVPASKVPAFLDVADRILLDAKPPKGADRPGGLGVPFDWSLLKALDPAIAFMLSGGLTPDTVAEAIQRVKPFGIDVSSGVETAPGEKDERLIAAFVRNARMAAAA